MEAPTGDELAAVKAAGASRGDLSPGKDLVVHWESRFGLVVIEVRDGRIYVNGDLVERMEPGSSGAPKANRITG